MMFANKHFSDKKRSKGEEKGDYSRSMVVLIWVQLLATVTALFSFAIVIITNDSMALTILIPSVFVDASAVTALVLWKRKTERIFSFFSDKEMRKSIEWFKEHDIDPVDFFRALKE